VSSSCTSARTWGGGCEVASRGGMAGRAQGAVAMMYLVAVDAVAPSADEGAQACILSAHTGSSSMQRPCLQYPHASWVRTCSRWLECVLYRMTTL
jgi:hypothetical protein